MEPSKCSGHCVWIDGQQYVPSSAAPFDVLPMQTGAPADAKTVALFDGGLVDRLRDFEFFRPLKAVRQRVIDGGVNRALEMARANGKTVSVEMISQAKAIAVGYVADEEERTGHPILDYLFKEGGLIAIIEAIAKAIMLLAPFFA